MKCVRCQDPRRRIFYLSGGSGFCELCFLEVKADGEVQGALESYLALSKPKFIPKPPRYLAYGLSESEYQTLYDEQEGRCAICSSATKLVIDHDHGTGAVRGLLCSKCNTGLHYVELDGFLGKALGYLNR